MTLRLWFTDSHILRTSDRDSYKSRWVGAREESGSSSGRIDGEDDDGLCAGMRGDRGLAAGSGIAMRKVCARAGGFRRGDSSGLLSREDISLGEARSGSDVHDAVRKMGCEGSVRLAWRTGEG